MFWVNFVKWWSIWYLWVVCFCVCGDDVVDIVMMLFLVVGCVFVFVVCEYVIFGVVKFVCFVIFVMFVVFMEEFKLWLVLFLYIIVLFFIVELFVKIKVVFFDFVVWNRFNLL